MLDQTAKLKALRPTGGPRDGGHDDAATYGPARRATMVVDAIIGWVRLELRDHTVMPVTAGIFVLTR
jgi:hypothetical protein